MGQMRGTSRGGLGLYSQRLGVLQTERNRRGDRDPAKISGEGKKSGGEGKVTTAGKDRAVGPM